MNSGIGYYKTMDKARDNESKRDGLVLWQLEQPYPSIVHGFENCLTLVIYYDSFNLHTMQLTHDKHLQDSDKTPQLWTYCAISTDIAPPC
jgi:hypothetical protein